ncbi:TetR family transcriptional regulator [Gemmatimonas sp.]|uniref:TetR/AcrR family transcriptional regulator n=1 Tax=Gemmatimonas sp. TaxID=1962908 RepID=UPI0033406D84
MRRPKPTPAPPKARARTPLAKADRRAVILEAARQRSRETPFAELTMASIAADVGLTKGTLYLYFQTKEELFLALLDALMQEWYDDVDGWLAVRRPRTLADVGAMLAEAFLARPDLTRLLAILESVLEQNIAFETAVAFKRTTLVRTARTGALLESALETLPAGAGIGVLMRCRALLVGLQVMAHPSPVVLSAFAAYPELAPFQIDFPHEVRIGIAALLAGALATPSSFSASS